MIFRIIMSVCAGFFIMLYGTGYIFHMVYGSQAYVSETAAKFWLLGTWAGSTALICTAWTLIPRIRSRG